MIGVRVPADLADDTSGLFEITSNKAMFQWGPRKYAESAYLRGFHWRKLPIR